MKRILIIDDERTILDTLDYLLSNLNYEVTTCESSLDGLELSLDNDYDLIITDYQMPGLKGLDLIKKIKKVKKNASIVLLSGFVEDKLLKDAHNAGAISVMEKPFQLSKIITLMEGK